jgi:hypothetical protein
MPRRTTVIGLLSVLALVCTLSAAAAEVPRWKGSWADARHIWATPQDFSPDDRETCRDDACGSEDGGRTWHPILRDTGPWGSVQRPLRASATAGVLAVKRGYRRLDVDHFWTNDAGRHWHRTSLFGRGPQRIVGNGRHVYWDVAGRVIYRVAPWPPTDPMVCPEGWRYDLGNRDAPPSTWGAACLNPPRGAALRSVVVRRFRKLFIRDSASFAQGAAWVLVPVERRRPLVLLIRQGRQRLVRLPRGDTPPETTSLSGFEIHAEWPYYIAVTAILHGDVRAMGCVFWESYDGGKSWNSSWEAVGGGWEKPYCNF